MIEPLEARIAPATFVVTNTTNDADGSLRDAIIKANAAGTADTITFNIAGSGVKTINLTTPLPELSTGLIIDGTSQHGYNGTPLIALNGSGISGMVDGLVLNASDTVIGLNIHSFTGNGIRIKNTNSAVYACWIGLNEAGTAAAGNGGSGVYLATLSNALPPGAVTRIVGSATPGMGNVIAGNGRYGIEDPGERSSAIPTPTADSSVINNKVGTNPAGDAAIGNAMGGIYFAGGDYKIENNLVSGNSGDGIHATGTSKFDDILIRNNVIGLGSSGTSALPNLGNGIYAGMFGSESGADGPPYASEILIGGANGRNVISGNTGAGIATVGATVHATGNYIGFDVTAEGIVANGGAGINLTGDFHTISGNVISGNGGDGIVVGSSQTIIDGNKIGTDPAGTGAYGNAGAGVRVTNGAAGFATTVNHWTIQPNTVTNNLIANNGAEGIAVVQTGKAYLVQNTLLANAGLGIHLTGQGDLLLPAPVLTGVASDGAGGVIIGGTYDDVPNATRILHFYTNSSAGAEAETYLGTATITTDAAGHASFSLNRPGTVALGQTVVATATFDGITTSPNGISTRTAYTSEISNATPVLPTGLTIGNASVTEGNSGTIIASFTVSLTSSSASTVAVQYATSDGSAKAGTDYANTTGTLTFDPGETSKTIEVTVNGDLNAEIDDLFHVLLSNPSGAALIDNDGLGTILNDDGPVVYVPNVSVTDVTVTEDDAGTVNATFTVNYDGPTTITTFIQYNTVDGTALAASDYDAISGLLTFAPGETSKTVVVPLKNDTAIESDESFQLHIAPGGANPTQVQIVDADGLGTILNDDSNVPHVSIGSTSITEGNSGTKLATFEVKLTGGQPGPVSVDFFTSNGTAANGSDYEATSGTLNFASGETSKTVSVVINGNLTFEDDETFHVGLTNASGATIVHGDGIGTILNDDTAPPPLTVAANRMRATWTDVDGDLVVLTANRPILDLNEFHWVYENLGMQMNRIDLSSAGSAVAGVNLGFSFAKHSPGDHHVNLGALEAVNLDLGKVTLPGDLGHVTAGDQNLFAPGIAKLSVLSLGAFGLETQGGFGSVVSEISSGLKTLSVKGDIVDAAVRIQGGSLKSASIGNRILATGAGGPTGLYADGYLGTINVRGSIVGHDSDHPVDLFGAADPGIKTVIVKGNVQFANIAAGLDADGNAVNGSARITTVQVGHAITATNITAGIDPGPDKLLGTADDLLLPLTSSLISRISRITARSIDGTADITTDSFGIFAQEVGALILSGHKQHLVPKQADTLALGTTGDVTLHEFV